MGGGVGRRRRVGRGEEMKVHCLTGVSPFVKALCKAKGKRGINGVRSSNPSIISCKNCTRIINSRTKKSEKERRKNNLCQEQQ